MKFVVFDLDETLGYFKQLYYIFSVLKKINTEFSLTQDVFNKVLDLYPEFLRPNIVDILLYLKHQKQYNRNTYVIVYTNNTHQNWTKYIISYIEYRLVHPAFFDRIINSFKNEVCRLHHKKHLDDLFRCIDYSSNSPICYIDNEYHPGMKSRQTYYCKLGGYVNSLPTTMLADRLYQSPVVNEIIPDVPQEVFSNIYLHYCNGLYTRVLTEAEYKHEYRTAQELMLRIRIFFMNSTTHKRRHTYSNQLEVMSKPIIESSENPFAGRHSEIINRSIGSDPIYNYYMTAGSGGGGGGGAGGGLSVSRISTSNKTKKNRRVL
jgi:hypothetical protein